MIQPVRQVKYNKFRLSDYAFARQVREKMHNALTSYDKAGNNLFDATEIEQALIGILNENSTEVYYVVQNVFRYDRDGDQKVTYKQFIDFCVEQHFGQLAIQRLHRQGTYSQGKKRIMNCQEFIKTVEYSMNSIGVYGKQTDYERLFGEVDGDKDGFISYEDYFIFLKEYFGSFSVISNESQAVIVVPPHNQPAAEPISEQIHSSISQPSQQYPNASLNFARLVYSQFKMNVLDCDQLHALTLNDRGVNALLNNILGMSESEKHLILVHLFSKTDRINYEDFMLFIIPFYFCEYTINLLSIGANPIDQKTFVKVLIESSSFLPVRPSEYMLKSMFAAAEERTTDYLSKDQYIRLLGKTLENYPFDYRGCCPAEN